MKTFHVVQEVVNREVYEVNASDELDAVKMIQLNECRLLHTEEDKPKIVNMWVKPIGIS